MESGVEWQESGMEFTLVEFMGTLMGDRKR